MGLIETQLVEVGRGLLHNLICLSNLISGDAGDNKQINQIIIPPHEFLLHIFFHFIKDECHLHSYVVQ